MNTAVSATDRYYQGRLYHQQRDIPHRHAGPDVLCTQTWVYQGAPGKSGNEWPARYTCSFRPIGRRYLVLWLRGSRVGSVELTPAAIAEAHELLILRPIQRDRTGTEHYAVLGVR